MCCSRCLISRIFCYMVDCDHLHVIHVEVFCVLVLILAILYVSLRYYEQTYLINFKLCVVCNFGRLSMSHVWHHQFQHRSIMPHTTLNSLLSCIHINTTNLFNITCTLIATPMILKRSECIRLNLIYISSSGASLMDYAGKNPYTL